MNRRHVLNVLLALSAVKMIPLTTEQAIAQTADEVEKLLKTAYSGQHGQYMHQVLQYPKEVANHFSLPLSDDSVNIISSINKAIEPALVSYTKQRIDLGLDIYNPEALSYFETVLRKDELGSEWYTTPVSRAQSYGIDLSHEAGNAIATIGKSVFESNLREPLSPEAGGGLIIVGAIVIVIVFGPRGKAATSAAMADDNQEPPFEPIIDPKLFEKF